MSVFCQGPKLPYNSDMSSKSVLITVLNFNGWEETLTCMDSILSQTFTDFDIYLVDNGSKDESLQKLKKLENHEKIVFQKNPANLGFSGGVNQGIRYAIEQDYPYVVLLNNDAVLTKDWLKKLVAAIKKSDASTTTGLLLNGDGSKIESSADSYSRWGLPFPNQRDEPVAVADESRYVFGGTAGASLYKTELFTDIGLFDEVFFAYYEDTDISYRAQLAGHTCWYEKSAVAYHDHGTTSNKMPGFTVKQTFKNLPLFFWKDTPFLLLPGNGIRFCAVYWLMYLRALLRGDFKPATIGLLGSIRYFPHALRERYRIQKHRRVTYTYLRSVIYPHLPPNTQRKGRRIFHK